MRETMPFRLQGFVVLYLYRGDNLLKRIICSNTVVRSGITKFLETIFDPDGWNHLSSVKVGSSATETNKLLTDLVSNKKDHHSVPIKKRDLVENFNGVGVGNHFTIQEYAHVNKYIRELGLFFRDGTMFSRFVLPTVDQFLKEDGIRVKGIWYVFLQRGEDIVPDTFYGDCTVSCEIGCELTCQGSCQVGSCQTGCEVTCQTGCEVAGCQTTCQASCQADCELSACQVGCEVSCQTTCQLDCQTNCQIGTCQLGCEMVCQTTCELSNQTPCATACELDCQTTCQLACQLTCELNPQCPGNCDKCSATIGGSVPAFSCGSVGNFGGSVSWNQEGDPINCVYQADDSYTWEDGAWSAITCDFGYWTFTVNVFSGSMEEGEDFWDIVLTYKLAGCGTGTCPIGNYLLTSIESYPPGGSCGDAPLSIEVS